MHNCCIPQIHKSPKLTCNLTRNDAMFIFRAVSSHFRMNLAQQKCRKEGQLPCWQDPRLPSKSDMVIYPTPPKLATCDRCYLRWLAYDALYSLSSRALQSSASTPDRLGAPQTHATLFYHQACIHRSARLMLFASPDVIIKYGAIPSINHKC